MSSISADFRLKLAQSALRNGIQVRMHLHGVPEPVLVKDMRNLKHSVVLTLDRNGGFMVVDPHSIRSVWVPKLPPAFEQEAI